MSDIDEKLKIVQSKIGCCRYHMESQEFRDEIKQAFAEAGYVNDVYRKTINDAFLDGVKSEAGLMTGQEWYDRFEKEYTGLLSPGQMHADDLTEEDVLKAAKRAAGLEHHNA